MTPPGSALTSGASGAAMVLLACGMILLLARLIRGPSLPDRVVALDLMGILGVGVVAAFAVFTGHAVYLDAAIVVALIAFLSAVAFARYIVMRGAK
jgi:multicomponent Na+:H+ antiporter subunit F